MKLEMPRYTRRSSRLPKGAKKSPQRSPSPNEEVIQRKLKSKRQRRALTTTKTNNIVVNTDKDGPRDLIDTINSTYEAERDGGSLLEVADEGLDNSDNESTASGPSLQRQGPPKKPRSPKDVCSACRKLYLKAKKMKAPMKNKLLDNDPKSLTCDQWVLIKTWTPRRLPSARGKLLSHIQLVQKRLRVKSDADTVEQFSTCSRQHAFLHRNLRKCVGVKKGRSKNRRKRTRDESRSPRIAKQQRLHKDNCHQDISTAYTDNAGPQLSSRDGSSSGFDASVEQEINDPEDTHMTLELIPTSVTLEITKPKAAPHKQSTEKRTGGFRNLLAQIRGNSSMIVKETS